MTISQLSSWRTTPEVTVSNVVNSVYEKENYVDVSKPINPKNWDYSNMFADENDSEEETLKVPVAQKTPQDSIWSQLSQYLADDDDDVVDDQSSSNNNYFNWGSLFVDSEELEEKVQPKKVVKTESKGTKSKVAKKESFKNWMKNVLPVDPEELNSQEGQFDWDVIINSLLVTDEEIEQPTVNKQQSVEKKMKENIQSLLETRRTKDKESQKSMRAKSKPVSSGIFADEDLNTPIDGEELVHAVDSVKSTVKSAVEKFMGLIQQQHIQSPSQKKQSTNPFNIFVDESEPDSKRNGGGAKSDNNNPYSYWGDLLTGIFADEDLEVGSKQQLNKLNGYVNKVYEGEDTVVLPFVNSVKDAFTNFVFSVQSLMVDSDETEDVTDSNRITDKKESVTRENENMKPAKRSDNVDDSFDLKDVEKLTQRMQALLGGEKLKDDRKPPTKQTDTAATLRALLENILVEEGNEDEKDVNHPMKNVLNSLFVSNDDSLPEKREVYEKKGNKIKFPTTAGVNSRKITDFLSNILAEENDNGDEIDPESTVGKFMNGIFPSESEAPITSFETPKATFYQSDSNPLAAKLMAPHFDLANFLKNTLVESDQNDENDSENISWDLIKNIFPEEMKQKSETFTQKPTVVNPGKKSVYSNLQNMDMETILNRVMVQDDTEDNSESVRLNWDLIKTLFPDDEPLKDKSAKPIPANNNNKPISDANPLVAKLRALAPHLDLANLMKSALVEGSIQDGDSESEEQTWDLIKNVFPDETVKETIELPAQKPESVKPAKKQIHQSLQNIDIASLLNRIMVEDDSDGDNESASLNWDLIKKLFPDDPASESSKSKPIPAVKSILKTNGLKNNWQKFLQQMMVTEDDSELEVNLKNIANSITPESDVLDTLHTKTKSKMERGSQITPSLTKERPVKDAPELKSAPKKGQLDGKLKDSSLDLLNVLQTMLAANPDGQIDDESTNKIWNDLKFLFPDEVEEENLAIKPQKNQEEFVKVEAPLKEVNPYSDLANKLSGLLSGLKDVGSNLLADEAEDEDQKSTMNDWVKRFFPTEEDVLVDQGATKKPKSVENDNKSSRKAAKPGTPVVTNGESKSSNQGKQLNSDKRNQVRNILNQGIDLSHLKNTIDKVYNIIRA
ncbi:hypothetical protein HDV02_001469 [Globomyces sp. JEL0801]|nr:hypothetical protein HDV02_001469 [Globomyces sp. JEL0801]